jgi:hypothetical protein
VGERGGVCVPVAEVLVGDEGVGKRCGGGETRSERRTAPTKGGRSATSITADKVFCFLARNRS